MEIILDQADKKILLEAIESIEFKAEKQMDKSDSLESFVQIVDYSSLASPNTQIIYGRYGTGKTHLLKAFYQYCEFNFDKTLVLPVYIDFQGLDLGNVLTSIPPSDLIFRFYQGFLYKVIERLEEFSKKVVTVGFLENMFGTGSAARKNNINRSIVRLKNLLKKEQIEEALEKYEREVTIDKETASKMGGQFNVSGQLGVKSKAELGANFGISDERMEKERETIDLIYKGLAIINYNFIRDELESLIHQCGARAIIILVDEWSSVDLSVQPILAEMIKKTLAISNKIILKIAALKYFTKTSRADLSRQRIGWQMGIDITPLADLDSLLCYDANEQVVVDFLTLVAYEHTCLAFPALRKHSINEFEDYLCGEIFVDPSAYLEDTISICV